MALVVGKWPFPETSGPDYCNAGLIRAFRRLSEVHVLVVSNSRGVPVREWGESADLVTVPPNREGSPLRRVAYALVGKLPSSVRWESEKAERVLAEISPDLCVFSGFNMLGIRPPRSAHTLLIPYDAYSMYSFRTARARLPLRERAAATARGVVYLRFERRAYPRLDAIAPVARPDVDYLRARTRANVLDGFLIPLPDHVKAHKARRVYHRPIRVLITGNYDIPAARSETMAVLQHLEATRARSTSTFDLVLLGRGAAAAFATFVNVGLRVVDWVDDFHAELSQADICVYPQWSVAGVQTKAQHALAAGTPLLTTPNVASGLLSDAADPSQCGILLASTPAEFSKQLVDSRLPDRLSSLSAQSAHYSHAAFSDERLEDWLIASLNGMLPGDTQLTKTSRPPALDDAGSKMRG